ncbi:MAG: rod shape-determining protein MreC [Oscillospiraceae bacterium]|nr:rod shape-determining protein MreC [Oscillospiraceae bacterium]
MFLEKHGLWILLAAVIITVTMAVMSAFGNGAAMPLKNLGGILASPFRAAVSGITGYIDDRIQYSSDYDALVEENKELKKQVADMEEQVRQAQTDSDENARLRELLNLAQQKRDLTCASAIVVDQTSSNWTRTITLNKGTRDGIAIKNCVINEEGCVVGTVTDVGVNWCTVLTCVDTDFEMGARVFRTQEAAVAQGDFNLMGQDQLRLEYISENGDIINGDLVVSSGLGGYYPPGLVIGSVTSVQTDASGSADYAVVSPAVDFDSLTEVFVITAFDVVE